MNMKLGLGAGLVLASLPLVVAAATQLPQRKAGMWEMTVQTSMMAGQPMTIQHCTDAKTDEQMMEQSMVSESHDCEEPKISKSGSTYTYTVKCNFERSKVTSKGTIKGDFAKAYTVETDTTFDPPMMGMSQDHTTVKAVHKGACPKGMVPGDMKMNGMTINATQPMQMPKFGENGMPSEADMKQMQDMMQQMMKNYGNQQ